MIYFACEMSGDITVAADSDYARMLSSEGFYRTLASVRIRCLLPLAIVGRHLPARMISYENLLRNAPQFSANDIFVLFKLGSSTAHSRPDVVKAISAFVKNRNVVYDTCDPLYDSVSDAVAAYQTDMLKHATAVVSGTTELATQLAQLVHGPITVIEDTIDCLPRAPKFDPSRLVRVAWFGWMSMARWTALGRVLDQIGRRCTERRFECLVLSQPLPANVVADANAFFARGGAAQIRLLHRPWALPEAWDHVAARDIALIPHEAGDIYKSHNRLSTALNCGIFPVASSIPSYAKTGESGWFGADLAEGVAWALDFPSDALARIGAGQKRVDELFSVEIIGARWVEMLRRLKAAG